jgi:hypothetical protein
MAGDWIKMRVDLSDDPAVIGMACALDCTEYEVVGRLHKVWSWADRHTEDGHAPSVTRAWLDRYVERDGFADAMVTAGWLALDESGISFPRFERHNGQSAKKRGLAADRKRKQRHSVTPESREESRTERDAGVTREEKRREEIVPPSEGASAPVDEIFGVGKKLLTDSGVSARSAGSHLGKLRKLHGDEAVLLAVREVARLRPSDPSAYLERLCRGESGKQLVESMTGGVSWS